jgi:hypothetical protein
LKNNIVANDILIGKIITCTLGGWLSLKLYVW